MLIYSLVQYPCVHITPVHITIKILLQVMLIRAFYFRYSLHARVQTRRKLAHRPQGLQIKLCQRKMSESIALPILTTSNIESISHSEYDETTERDRTERFVNYNADVIGLILMMSSFSIIGIPSNLLLVVVFRQRQIRHYGTTNLFALSLAVTDAIICAITIPLLTCSVLGMIRTDFGCAITVFIAHTTVSVQVNIMLGVCIERYCAICRPLHRWHTKHVIVFISTAFVYCGSISALAFPTVVFDDTTFYFCERQGILTTNVMDALSVFSWFVVVTIMAVLYTITIVTICTRARMKQKIQDASRVRNVIAHANGLKDVIT